MKDFEKALDGVYHALKSAHHFIKSQDQGSMYVTEKDVPVAVRDIEKRVADALNEIDRLSSEPE